MSGLKNEPITGGKFVNFKDGKLISSASGTKEEFNTLEGKIVSLDILDEEYKGKEYRKIIIDVQDDEGTVWRLGFPLESGYGNAWCSLAMNVDFTKPVQISGGTKEMENERTFGVMFVRQLDETGKWQAVKWFYTKESKEVPHGVKAKDRSGEYWDFSERNDFFHHLLIDTVLPAINGAVNGVAKSEGKPKTTKTTKGK
jgi:hypothetical protein